MGGDLTANNNLLKTLKGAPEIVGGRLDIQYNQLTSMMYSPSRVGKGLYCYSNQITSMQYMSEYVGGSINCANNNLPSLEYIVAPKNGFLYFHGNDIDLDKWMGTKPPIHEVINSSTLVKVHIATMVETDALIILESKVLKAKLNSIWDALLNKEYEYTRADIEECLNRIDEDGLPRFTADLKTLFMNMSIAEETKEISSVTVRPRSKVKF